MNRTAKQYENTETKDIPLPFQNWAAFEIIPLEIEFWRYGSNNLHLRHKYNKHRDEWNCIMLDS